jgi:hypothetical protein
LLQSRSPVLVPFDNSIILVRSLNYAEFSGRPAKVAQALDAIARNHFLLGDRPFANRWLLRAI